jgi:DNA-binding transcriptional ArsR family regulator
MAGKRTTEDVKEWAQGFRMLSDPTRLGILATLAKGPRNVTALCKVLGLKQPIVSTHLGIMRLGRLVAGTRQGKSVVYEANKAALKELARVLKAMSPK